MPPVLSVQGLTTRFHTADGVVRAVEDISFDLGSGETLGIVGESGCGKSVTGLSIMGLIPPRQGRIVRGSIMLDDRNLVSLPEREMRRLRGDAVAMVFQEPMTSLNPVMTVGDQIAETVRIHQGAPEGTGGGKGHGDAGTRAHPRSAPSRQRISASFLRRHAPAGDDRDGLVLQSQGPHRR